MAKIKKGDTVEIISGNDRGVRGVVQRVLPKKDRAVISGVNIIKKHQRPTRAGRSEVQAGVIEFEAPIHMSNVMLVCPQCDEPTRVGFTQQEGGHKVRVCKRCGEAVE